MGGCSLPPSAVDFIAPTGGYIRRLLCSQYAYNGIARLVCRNLLCRQATSDIQKENIVAPRQVKTVFDYLPDTFTRKQFQDAIKKAGYKSGSANMLCTFKRRGKIVHNDDDTFSIV